MRVRPALVLALVFGLHPACAAGPASREPAGSGTAPEPPSSLADGDVLLTRLEVDLAARRGRATLLVAPEPDGFASLDVSGLRLERVACEPAEVVHRLVRGRLALRAPAGRGEITIRLEYGFEHRRGLDGATASGLALTWPGHCGNLFPCQPEPAEGSRYQIALTGVPEGSRAVYPAAIPFDAPAYMVAWAVGPFERAELGRTLAGTAVAVYYRAGEEQAAARGTAHLRAAFDWLERTYGPYPFGDEVASVSVDWGQSAYGGMEHHPYWHVSSSDLHVEYIHVHEAAHGWFGNGVRIRCWEDFVLSEGTTSYVTARALAAVAGPAAGDALWDEYWRRLLRWESRGGRGVAWPATCGAVDVERDLFNATTYMRGAYFLRAVALRVGAEALDSALRAFYLEHKGRAAGMDDLLEAVRRETGFDPRRCAEAWLRSAALPAPEACPGP